MESSRVRGQQNPKLQFKRQKLVENELLDGILHYPAQGVERQVQEVGEA